MSQPTLQVAPAAVLPLSALLETLAALEVEWRVADGHLSVRDSYHVLTIELKAAVGEHKPALIALAARRSECARLLALIERLRCEDPKKGTRQQALAFVQRGIDDFAATCDLVDGYTDPEDPDAADALRMMREELAELTKPDAPYPLGPLPADPFAAGRRFNGKTL